jgi:hypothetical protein
MSFVLVGQIEKEEKRETFQYSIFWITARPGGGILGLDFDQDLGERRGV